MHDKILTTSGSCTQPKVSVTGTVNGNLLGKQGFTCPLVISLRIAGFKFHIFLLIIGVFPMTYFEQGMQTSWTSKIGGKVFLWKWMPRWTCFFIIRRVVVVKTLSTRSCLVMRRFSRESRFISRIYFIKRIRFNHSQSFSTDLISKLIPYIMTLDARFIHTVAVINVVQINCININVMWLISTHQLACACCGCFVNITSSIGQRFQ